MRIYKENMNQVNYAFRKVTSTGIIYNTNNNIIDNSITLGNIPDIMYEYIEKNKYGDSFAFASYMMKILNDNNVDNYMIISNKDNRLNASVLYEEFGELFVANPTEDIKYFTKNKIKTSDRYDFYIPKTSILLDGDTQKNNAEISFKEFYKENGTILALPQFKDEYNIELIDAKPFVIADQNNVIDCLDDIKKISKTK